MTIKKQILQILKGIDKTEIESEAGWWETSEGAEFGVLKLKEIEKLLAESEQEALSDEEIEVWFLDHNLATDNEDYTYGFRDAEKAHGIGVEL